MKESKYKWIKNTDFDLLTVMSNVLGKNQIDILHEALTEYYWKINDRHRTIIKAYMREIKNNGAYYDNR